MFQKIIVGIDGADGGRDALALADRLASPDAELVLVHAFPDDVRSIDGVFEGDQGVLHDEVERMLRGDGGDRRHRVCAVADSSPARALHDHAEREHADLIVLGSCHRGRIGRVLLGDVSRATLHGASCSVAVAPHGFRDAAGGPFVTVGVGYDGTVESEAALALAARLARSFGGNLRALTAIVSPLSVAGGPVYTFASADAAGSEDRVGPREELELATRGLDVPCENETVHESPGRALEELSGHVDLIIDGTRGWGAGHRVVLGSTTDRLTHHAHCPVIVVPLPVAAAAPAAVAVAT